MFVYKIHSLSELPPINFKNFFIYMGEFSYFSCLEQKLIYALLAKIKKTKQKLIIINFNNTQENVPFFRNNKDQTYLIQKLFSKLIWYDLIIDCNYETPSLQKEIIAFSALAQKENCQITAPLAEKLHLVEQKNGQKKEWALIHKQNQNIWENFLQGKCDQANQKLGYYFFLSGHIVQGNQLGQKIGFPTINIEINQNFFFPRLGCYITITVFDNQKIHWGLTCLIKKKSNELYCETYLEKFQKKVYREHCQVYFLSFYRDNKTINSNQDLKMLLIKDLKFLKNKPVFDSKMLI